MGSFTADELANAANSLIDFHIKGKAVDQIRQARPMLDRLVKMQKTFPGGKDLITGPVRGSYSTEIQGFSHDDEVDYGNPTPVKRWSANWYEVHAGIKVTFTELKHAGISVVDSTSGAKTSNHSEQDAIQLTNILDEKIYDMEEGSVVSFAKTMMRDGSADPLLPPGVPAFLSLTPTTGVVEGIDRGLNSYWRNRADATLSTTTPSDMAISRKIQREVRQLKRYKPNSKLFGYMGEGFLDAWEQEARAKGYLTQDGWARKGNIDMSLGDISFKGIQGFEYEPLMDDLGYNNELWIIDHDACRLYVMDGEDWKQHTPARNANQYVLHKAQTWTGGMAWNQLNSSGRYKLA
jgi:hypothetical protein